MDVNSADDKKSANKAKSHITGPSSASNPEATKRKSFNVNEAVRSLDIALGRLKKSKLANGEHSAHTSPVRHSVTSRTFDSLTEPNSNADRASLMSMNFSHYELMRNISCTNSDSAFSTTTCNTMSSSDMTSKNEHLERYFRSVETWCRHNEP